jgi:hypothetical protein
MVHSPGGSRRPPRRMLVTPLIALGIFGVVALWRLAGPPEEPPPPAASRAATADAAGPPPEAEAAPPDLLRGGPGEGREGDGRER